MFDYCKPERASKPWLLQDTIRCYSVEYNEHVDCCYDVQDLVRIPSVR